MERTVRLLGPMPLMVSRCSKPPASLAAARNSSNVVILAHLSLVRIRRPKTVSWRCGSKGVAVLMMEGEGVKRPAPSNMRERPLTHAVMASWVVSEVVVT